MKVLIVQSDINGNLVTYSNQESDDFILPAEPFINQQWLANFINILSQTTKLYKWRSKQQLLIDRTVQFQQQKRNVYVVSKVTTRMQQCWIPVIYSVWKVKIRGFYSVWGNFMNPHWLTDFLSIFISDNRFLTRFYMIKTKNAK